MEIPNYSEELSGAEDLLKMLEALAVSYSKSKVSGKEIPWGGILLTLGQVRERVSRANVQAIEQAREIFHEEREQVKARPSGGVSLADRIQQAPSGHNRVRELLNNVSPAQRKNPGPNGGTEEDTIDRDL